ncbi:MAG: polyprenyl synthetase family protein [Planctomycetia bacterium]
MFESSAALNRSVPPWNSRRGGETATAAPTPATLRCPDSRQVRERLRAIASDLVSVWRAEGVPASVRTAAGLRGCAETVVKRASAGPEHVGWTMVTIVSEFWRDRLAAAPSGRRLLLLPDCPAVSRGADTAEESAAVPRVCGPSCGIATIWSAARDSGWVVEPVDHAVAGIGSLLTGQYDGVLGIARLADLEKAFAMLPAFSLPVAAVPYEPLPAGATGGCASSLAASAIDVEWVLGLLGVAGGGAAPVGDYLPLLREAADMFTANRLAGLSDRLSLGPVFGPLASGIREAAGGVAALEATAGMASDFLTRGGKFLRPFICLAAHDAIRADGRQADAGRCGPEPGRDAVRAASVAIEVFHKASLVHDDIEDQDTMRYGRPTLHVEHGIPAAINAGDYLLGLGYRIVSGLPGVDASTLRDLVLILSDAHIRLAQGQGAELQWRDGGDKRLSPREALAIYGLKTSPAFEAAVAMGIRLAGVQPAEAGQISGYSLHVGTGFQVLNDLKDWSGDLENNRRAAGDLLGGRPTVMWAVAMERLAEADCRRLKELALAAGRGEGGEASIAAAVAELRELYAKAGVFEQAANIVAEERRLAAAAAATCRWRRLRDVLEFLLDLAVPEQAASQYLA